MINIVTLPCGVVSQMKEAVKKHGEHKTLFGKCFAVYEAIGILHVRGEWEEHDVFLPKRVCSHIQKHHSLTPESLETRFVER